MERGITELTSLLFKTKQLIRHELPTRHDANAWLRLEILNFIASAEEATMRAIAEYLRIKPPSATSLITALESDGLVVRVKHPSDRRAVHVSLTETGAQRLALYRRESHRALETVFSRLSSREIETLKRVLKRLLGLE